MRQNIIKVFFVLLTLWTLNGCTSSRNYYVLSMASNPTDIYSNTNKVIGVEKIVVPNYLYKREIAVAKSSNQITLLSNAVWGEDLDDGLTQRLIIYLQKKFNQPNVYGYPWGMNRQPNIKVKVNITRFIAQGNTVYLDANWEIENMRSGRRKASLFNASVATNNDANVIVSSMDKAFEKLEKDIAKGVRGL